MARNKARQNEKPHQLPSFAHKDTKQLTECRKQQEWRVYNSNNDDGVRLVGEFMWKNKKKKQQERKTKKKTAPSTKQTVRNNKWVSAARPHTPNMYSTQAVRAHTELATTTTTKATHKVKVMWCAMVSLLKYHIQRRYRLRTVRACNSFLSSS